MVRSLAKLKESYGIAFRRLVGIVGKLCTERLKELPKTQRKSPSASVVYTSLFR